MKTCTKCGIEKELTDFGKNKSYKDRLNYYCKSCSSLRTLEWYRIKNPIIKNNKHGTGGLDDKGYKTFFKNGKRIREHRLIMEQYLGRKLTNLEHIHHINGNKLDNRIENLQLMTNSEHMSLHHKNL